MSRDHRIRTRLYPYFPTCSTHAQTILKRGEGALLDAPKDCTLIWRRLRVGLE